MSPICRVILFTSRFGIRAGRLDGLSYTNVRYQERNEIVKKTSASDVTHVKQKVLPILKRYSVRRAGIFGSSARGEIHATSDIDILVDLDKSVNLFDFVGLKQELEEALGRKVDLVEYDRIKPLIRERVLGEQIQII